MVTIAAADDGEMISGEGEYDHQPIGIVKDERTQSATGDHSFNFDTANGIFRQKSGTQDDGQVTSGWFEVSYLFTSFITHRSILLYI